VPFDAPISLYDAKARFSSICEKVSSTGEEVIVSRHGRPVVKIVPYRPPKRFVIGLAEGEFTVPEDVDAPCPDIERLFEGEP